MNPLDRGGLTTPDLGALTGVATGIAFVGAIVGAMRLAARPIPRPGSPAADVRDYYSGSARAARFSVAGQAVSILSLARFTVSVARLARHSGGAPRALQAAAVVSGGGAVASLAASAATHALLTVPRDRDDETLVALSRRVFVLGGPIHGVAYGVLTGVLAEAGRRTGMLGPPAVAAGLVSAVSGVASPLYFRWENAGWLIPIGRFSGYLLAGIAGVRLARGAGR